MTTRLRTDAVSRPTGLETWRIADRAEPGTVLVSDVVKQLCEGKTFEFVSLDEVSLKGFDEAVTLFEVSV